MRLIPAVDWVMMVKSAQIIQTEELRLKKQKNKSILVLTVFSVILCGCPGVVLLFTGFPNLIDGLNKIAFAGEVSNNTTISILLNVGIVCLSGILLLVPLGLVIYLLVQRNKKTPLEPLEPTGVSEEDPIPPTH